MFKRLVSTLLLSLCLVASVNANTAYWVGFPGGSDTQSGLTEALSWETIAKANAAMVAPNTANGTVVLHINNGTYFDFPNPVASPLNGSRFTYLGNVAKPESVSIQVRAASLTKKHVTVAGVRGIGSLTVGTAALFDTVRNCVFASSLSLHGNRTAGGGGNVIVNSTFLGNHLTGGEDDTLLRSNAHVIESCAFPNLGRGVWNQGCSDGHVVSFSNMDSCRWTRNRFSEYGEPRPARDCSGSVSTADQRDTHLFQLYGVTYSLFNANRWDVTNDEGDNVLYVLSQRDGSGFNTFVSDTFLVGGGGSGVPILAMASQTVGWVQRTANTRMDSCFIKTPGYVGWPSGMKTDTLRYNTMVSSHHGSVLVNENVDGYPENVGLTLISHNTFVAPGDGGVVHLTAKNDTLHFTNNICVATGRIVDLANGGSSADQTRYAADFDAIAKWDSTFSKHYGTVACDSTVRTHASSAHLDSHHNLFSYYGSTGSVGTGTRCISWIAPGSIRQSSKPGDGALWECKFAQDSLSYYGSPQFYDSTYATFDPHLLTGSPAIAAAFDGTDIGSTAYALYPAIQLSRIDFLVDRGWLAHYTVTLTNTGGSDLTVSAITSSDAHVTISPTSATVSAGADQTLTITYTPNAVPPPGEVIVTILSDAHGAPASTIRFRESNQIDP